MATKAAVRTGVRQALLDVGGLAVVELAKELKNPDAAIRQGAADKILKYGVGHVKEITVDSVRERVSKTLDVIRQLSTPEKAAELIAALRPVWS